jgi:hypothetical protein
MYVLFLFTVKTFGKTLRILMPCLVQSKMAKIKESQIEMDKNHYQTIKGKRNL